MTEGNLYRQPLSNRVGTRRLRRRLVVGTYGGWLLIAATVKLTTLTSPGWIKPGFVVIGVLTAVNLIVSVAWLERRTYINTPKLADAELDERLVQVRNAAFRTAFRVFSPVALVAWLLSWAAMQLQPGDMGLLNSFVIFSGVALLANSLPTAIVAWREPDPAEPEPLRA
jgi:hypothetical protein